MDNTSVNYWCTLKYFFLIIFSYSVFLYPQISPGDLTKAHASLEGISNCTKCHEIGEKVKNSNCLSCHAEISELINQKRGYHSSIEVNGKNCSGCHSEHHGRNFRIVNFNPDNFDHSKTTFILTGSHLKIKCADCHTKSHQVNAEAKKKNLKWVGLNTSCISCHTDYHQGTLGNSCSGCHNTEKFRPSVFDHNKAKFVLTGAHLKTECVKCHVKEKRGGKEFQKFKGTAFGTCENCHKDIHSARLGKNCSSCHNTNSFRSINQSAFDHSKTGFQLVGKHQSVSCNSCHKSGYKERIKHELCIDCHKDYHDGEFTVNNIVKDCRACHNENGFRPSVFSIQQHENSRFPLTGSHLAVPCAGCHLAARNTVSPASEKWKFRSIGLECIDCHENIHKKEIEAKFLAGSGCRNCHVTAGWYTIIFDHSKTDFPLSGRHESVSCRKCHMPVKLESQRFASLKSFCTECHDDVHVNQFGSGEKEECLRCHSFSNWKPEKFDHNKTKFSLEGAHSKLECSKCHKSVSLGDRTFIKYKLEDFKCASCHS